MSAPSAIELAIRERYNQAQAIFRYVAPLDVLARVARGLAETMPPGKLEFRRDESEASLLLHAHPEDPSIVLFSGSIGGVFVAETIALIEWAPHLCRALLEAYARLEALALKVGHYQTEAQSDLGSDSAAKARAELFDSSREVVEAASLYRELRAARASIVNEIKLRASLREILDLYARTLAYAHPHTTGRRRIAAPDDCETCAAVQRARELLGKD